MTDNKKVLLKLSDLKQYFFLERDILGRAGKVVKANDGVSFEIYDGETFGLVGESGCGKSTLGRTILQLNHQTAGRVLYYGKSVWSFAPRYTEEILKNPVDFRKLCRQRTQKAALLRKAWEDLPEGKKKGKLYFKWLAAQDMADNAVLDFISLLGGGYILSDDELTELGSWYAKRSRILKETPADTSGLLEAEKAIQAICVLHQDDPDFLYYEAQKDDGINLSALTEDEMRRLRQELQLVFQDPYSSLNPRMTVGQIIREGLQAHNLFRSREEDLQEHIVRTMEQCGLDSYFIHRYPHQFSGGQRQRIGIARVLALTPKFVVCDEAVSALDVSVQSQIINLLLDLKKDRKLTYLFISHDLSVIKYISDRVGVMYLGNLVELSDTAGLFRHPYHPYTEALLSAIPTIEPNATKQAVILEGNIPSPVNPPDGCKFHTRCRYCTQRCKNEVPAWEEVEPGHFVACHHKLSRKEGACLDAEME